MEPAANNNQEGSSGPRWELEGQQSDTPQDNIEQLEQRRYEPNQEQQQPIPIKDYANGLGLEFYGINKKLYKKPEKNGKNPEDPPFKSMTDYVFLPCSPEFERLPEVFQPVNIPKQNVLEESLRKEVESILFADAHINRMVYDSKDPSPFTSNIDPASLGLDVLPYYLPQSRDDSLLVFESRFESGNLKRVIQISDNEYDLILSTDFQTTAHTQWYYFSVSNTRKNVEYRFKIVNMTKADSLYNVGMKPLVYSDKKAKQSQDKMGWHRSGTDICYYATNLKRKNGGYYNALCFTLKFEYDNDCVYIAHCYPYTYTQLQKYLRGLENDPMLRSRFNRKTMCLTESGNNCDYLTIGETAFNNVNSSSIKDKKVIFLTARVHPGQTMVSYLIEYIIDFLLSNHPVARQLRDNFIFRIIPMLNIDGVINGNYRCNLFGADLNRQWIEPSRKAHPSIYYAKNLIKKTKEERQLLIYCDFHGHSRKKNIFIYGCSGKDPVRREQIFPMLMKNNSPVFSFKDCCFNVQKDREGAARIALWKQLNIINCFTMEISFCGSDFGKYEYFHFNLTTFKELAFSFCQSIYDHYEPDQIKYKQALQEIEVVLKTIKYQDKKGDDTDDSDYSGDDIKESPNINNINGSEPKQNQQKKSLQGRQHNSLPQSDANKVIIKKKIPITLPAKKKK